MDLSLPADRSKAFARNVTIFRFRFGQAIYRLVYVDTLLHAIYLDID